MTIEITKEIAAKVLATVDAGLTYGLGNNTPGEMCVEAAVCYALGLPHGDDPKCVASSLRMLKINLNDSHYWGSDDNRAKGLRKLAILQLGTMGRLDEKTFVSKVVMLLINKYLPQVLKRINLIEEAKSCEKASNIKEAKAAATAANAANMAAAAYAAAVNAAAAADYAAASAAVNAAAAAADAAAAVVYIAKAVAATNADAAEVLAEFAEDVSSILIEMDVPGVQWLDLL